jgi:smad nuclear-interacting protein 1
LLGRAAEVADIHLEHPSCSQQHAAIQFRWVTKTVEDESGVRKQTGKVKPYIIDLGSSNGTILNDEPIEPERYIELRNKDILRFGGSERDYMLMLPPRE